MFEIASKAYKDLGNYKDSREQLKETYYQYASFLINNSGGNKKTYEEAFDMLLQIEDYQSYKDVYSKLINVPELLDILWNRSFKVGNEFLIGTFEQDNNTTNGTEPIEWIVIANSNGKALLLSKYVLIGKEFNDDAYYGEAGSEHNSVTWEKSTLYTWLNKEFIKSFTKTEQSILKKSNNGTVFLLSEAELKQYLPNEKDRVCQPTKYAIQRGVNPKDGAWWWLRDVYFRYYYKNGNEISSRYRCYESGLVYGSGEISESSVTIEDYGVRPAVWIDYSNGPIADWLQREKGKIQ